VPTAGSCCATLTRKARMRSAKVEGGARHEIELAHTRSQRACGGESAPRGAKSPWNAISLPAGCYGETWLTCGRRVNAGANVAPAQ